MQTEKLSLQAVGDFLLVEQLRPTKAGAIFLPQTDVRKYNIGRVASVGPQVRRAEPGNIVLWQVFKGQAVDHRDDERWFIQDADVLGIVKDPPKWMVDICNELDEAGK